MGILHYPLTAQVLEEAARLSGEILTDIELGRVPLSVAELQVVRLSLILGDSQDHRLFVEHSAGEAGTETTGELESTVAKGQAVLEGKLALPGKYAGEWALNDKDRATRELDSRRTLVYDYAARKHYEVRFSRLAEDVFARIRSRIDSSIGSAVPDAVKKLTAAHDNLASDNAEDWSNAAHSCRRVLQDLADALFPPQEAPRVRVFDGKQLEIKLGADQYINRLVAYVEDSSESGRFNEIVGSHLRYIGDRLDSLFTTAQKGSHATVTKEEADRCVVYTYLLVGDILSLRDDGPK